MVKLHSHASTSKQLLIFSYIEKRKKEKFWFLEIKITTTITYKIELVHPSTKLSICELTYKTNTCACVSEV